MSLIEQLKKRAIKIDLKGASPEDCEQISNGLIAISTKPATANLEIKLSEQVQKQVEEAINASVSGN